jgi:hypothetical protein
MEVMCVCTRHERTITSQKAGKLGPSKESCSFGDEYKVKYNMDYDENRDKYDDKMSKLVLHEKHDSHTIVGEVEFNLGDYVEKGEKVYKMPIRTHTD